MPTNENLKAAFAGESQARNKYTLFAKKADEDGYPGVAKLFRAAAEAEFIHASLQFKALGGISSTAENLEAAVKGETYEFTEMYPGFIEESKKDGSPASSVRVFEYANGAEKVHAELYTEALRNLDSKEDADYYFCPVCGHIEKGHAPEKCPICGAPGSKYKNVG